MKKLKRGLLWGSIMSILGIVIVLQVYPIFDFIALCISLAILAICMGLGFFLNLRARKVTCSEGHSFLATSGSSRCPDCGESYSEIKQSQNV